MAQARVVVVDKMGRRWETRTDDKGDYRIELVAPTAPAPPLLIAANEAGNDNCLRVDRPRARCMSALLGGLTGKGEAVANVNPLTDWIVSKVAVEMNLLGPQQLVEKGTTAEVANEGLAQQQATFRALWKGVLAEAKIAGAATFDPVTRPIPADHRGVDGLFDLLHHNRGYDRNTGKSATTLLTDLSFRPITGGEDEENFEPLQVKRNQQERRSLQAAQTRVLIVGDSTAASYEKARFPRLGWGQVFETRFKPAAKVKVQNGARAGRSSRDFFMAGWYGQVARYLRKGDYLLIQMGHNDQNCNARKPDRGMADVANLCTYPNNDKGERQFPVGQPGLSFQTNLERYIDLARVAGAIPVLLTPTARVLDENKKPGVPAVPSHVTRDDPQKAVLFVGDYAQTVRDTAKANHVPLIEIEEASRAWVNRLGDPAWKDYYLVVDPAKHPYYQTHPGGTIDKPDTTHFQARGAKAIANMVVAGIKANPALGRLASLLK